ncbi:HAMP domain-containing protein, partial [Mesorhizobium sp. CAU 1741]|uniref:HAMP domain-containing protein n=1 Tax=Mesorhizobium sp. CAU 1741 TaxID=3140366 RepID=UPI00325A727D
MSFSNLSISRKLGLAFFAVVATIILMCATMVWNLQRLEQAVEAEATASRSIDTITNAQFRLSRQENSFRGFLLSNDAYYIERLASHRAAFDEQLNNLREWQRGHDNEAEMVARIDAAQAAMSAWQAEIVDAGVILARDPITRFRAIELVGQSGKADGLIAPIEESMDAMQADERAEVAEAVAIRNAAEALTETVLYLGLLGAVLISIVLGYLLSRSIARPVSALTSVMGRLASGENSVEVPAVSRKDEIGEMARAVLVFKEAAIEKLRLEGRTEEERSLSEAERARNESEKARVAEEDHVAISSLADGLSALASGDLTYRITAPFAPKTQKLKDDFNRTADQLEETMSTISGAIGGMRSGTSEVSQAADD